MSPEVHREYTKYLSVRDVLSLQSVNKYSQAKLSVNYIWRMMYLDHWPWETVCHVEVTGWFQRFKKRYIAEMAKPKGSDFVQPLSVDLISLYTGTTKKIRLSQRTILCPSCGGSKTCTGGELALCWNCHGTGKDNTKQGEDSKCVVCMGEKTLVLPGEACTKCKAHGTVFAPPKIVVIDIAPGTGYGDKFTFPGLADHPGVRYSLSQCPLPYVFGMQVLAKRAGNLIIVIQTPTTQAVTPFKRLVKPKQEHLLTEQTISLTESLFGFEMSLKHMDGRSLFIRSAPGVISEGSVRIVRGEGMPFKNSKAKGDLYIRFRVATPKSLSPQELAILEQAKPIFQKIWPALHQPPPPHVRPTNAVAHPLEDYENISLEVQQQEKIEQPPNPDAANPNDQQQCSQQ